MENLEEEEKKLKTKEQITPFSREVNNYLTSKASTVKMDNVQNCVQWPFVLNYSSSFGTVRLKVMRLCLWRPICHWSSLDGWIDWAVYTVAVSLFSVGWSFLSPTVQ